MELAVYFSHIEDLQRIDEALEAIDVSEGMDTIGGMMFFLSPNGMEYFANLKSLDSLHQSFGPDLPLERLYFGQEFCQFLVPDTEELRQAYYVSRQLGWDFTYLTPGAVTDEGLETVRGHLAFLQKEAPGTEVVANSWGILHLLSRDFAGLRPVLGRMLNKQIRLARDPEVTPPRNLEGISGDGETVMRHQIEALRGLSISIPAFRRELERLGVVRFEIDIVPQGVDVPEDRWGFGASCYYPWTYVTSGRNCLTAAEADPEREFVVPEGTCSRPCRRVNVTTLLERGNTVFMLNGSFAGPYLNEGGPVDRLVFTPYPPL